MLHTCFCQKTYYYYLW